LREVKTATIILFM